MLVAMGGEEYTHHYWSTASSRGNRHGGRSVNGITQQAVCRCDQTASGVLEGTSACSGETRRSGGIMVAKTDEDIRCESVGKVND